MSIIEEFFREVDQLWSEAAEGRVPLHVFGSAALLLQTDYERGTKDADVLQTPQIPADIRERLHELAGRKSELHSRRRIYLEVVTSGFPLLPHVPLYHRLDGLNASLQHFEIAVLDVVDVCVSKLARFSRTDRDDIKAMVDRRLVDHARLLERFKDAVDEYAGGAGADDVPEIIRHLHQIERDLLGVPESPIELPPWLEDRL